MGMETATLQPWPQLSGILKGPELFLSILSHLYRGPKRKVDPLTFLGLAAENWSFHL